MLWMERSSTRPTLISWVTISSPIRSTTDCSIPNLARVTFVVRNVNDAPLASSDAYTTNQGRPLTVVASGLLANDSDVDGDALTARLAATSANGSVTVNVDGSFTYSPADGFSGSDSFTYVANDGTVDSSPATVTITVDRHQQLAGCQCGYGDH